MIISLLKLLKKTSVAIFVLTLSNPNALAFSDTQSYWAKHCIEQLKERKLITGYPDGSFRPETTVTRAQAAVLMLNAFPDSPVKRTAMSFKDVSCCAFNLHKQHFPYFLFFFPI